MSTNNERSAVARLGTESLRKTKDGLRKEHQNPSSSWLQHSKSRAGSRGHPTPRQCQATTQRVECTPFNKERDSHASTRSKQRYNRWDGLHGHQRSTGRHWEKSRDQSRPYESQWKRSWNQPSSVVNSRRKSSSVEDHLKEIDHVLDQLMTAGAKIALHKGQWCKTKVNYVELLVGRKSIEPQSNRTQTIQSIKTPTNVSELRSFLWVCNYSQQFMENYIDIARPLTSLLCLDGRPGHRNGPAQTAPVLCSVPCLPRPRKIILSGCWIL